MKTELKAKFIQHIVGKKKESEGFTLIELLVVIIIIGILSAIALPSFLNQANKAKQSEAKQNVGAMNRQQQAYYLEKNTFTSNMSDLGLGIKTASTNYKFSISTLSSGAVVGITNRSSRVTATAPLKVYIGGVNVGLVAATSEATTLTVLCEAVNPGTVSGAATGIIDSATYASAGPSCPGTYTTLN
ncbi:MAG: type IV pilin-like G/H family protein [Nostoc sp. ChiSLP02]|nr:type IV pilin-like G/H family protein [Nostoc sp. DedSLP05]MDZ8101610.1 type IV pilin-like G/H family protein [Nostoc sp. DedSLP01]MDZ8189542.1 type IV pilin-like G/H family protein [Nostoc sp. ChiSLP02]